MKQIQRNPEIETDTESVEEASETFYHVEQKDATEGVSLEISRETVTRRISETSGGRQIDIDSEEERREVSYPGIRERYSTSGEDDEPEVILEAPETGNPEINPVVSGYVFIQPHQDPQQIAVPMEGSLETETEETEGLNFSSLGYEEPGTASLTRTLDPDIGLPYSYTEIERYYPEQEENMETVAEYREEVREIGDEEIYMLLEEPEEGFQNNGYQAEEKEENDLADEVLKDRETGIDMGYAEVEITGTVAEEAETLEEALDYMFQEGVLEGTVMETPYYSESSGENFDAGWNRNPQVVELEGMDMDFVEYTVNGELAENHIGEIQVSEGDEIRLEADEVYDSHGEYEAGEETYEAWSERYGEQVWDDEWDSIDRQIYAGVIDGEDPGGMDFTGREHVLEALEETQDYGAGFDGADYVWEEAVT